VEVLRHAVHHRRHGRAGIFCLCLGLLVVTPVSGPASDATDGPAQRIYRNPAPGYRYQFPRDHGSHRDFRTEWWYYTGHLTAKDGRRFGFQLTFFRRGVERDRLHASPPVPNLPSRWTITDLYFAHLALSDLDRSRFRYAEKISRAGLGKAGADPDRLHVWIDRWSVEAQAQAHAPSDVDRHRLKAAGRDFAMDLTVDSQKPPVIHGTEGISRKGQAPDQASHYYSLSRLEARGLLSVEGQDLAVTGSAWMDHEFGSGALGNDQVGWDWFGLHLNNGQDLMLYRLRRADGTADPASSGTLIRADGSQQPLSATDIHLSVLDHWTSRDSAGRYPSRWRIAIPSAGLALEITPELSNQELITRHSTRITYWEGAARITGTDHGAPVDGSGYVELTGYAEPFKSKP
jgi:predicted secreted hydrolase